MLLQKYTEVSLHYIRDKAAGPYVIITVYILTSVIRVKKCINSTGQRVERGTVAHIREDQAADHAR